MSSFLNLRANKVVVVVVETKLLSETKNTTLCGPRLSPIPCPGLFLKERLPLIAVASGIIALNSDFGGDS